MSTVTVSNIPSSITTEKLNEFFSFCGNVKSINIVDKNGSFVTAEVTFESEKAISTAILLNEAELDGSAIKVEESNSSTSKETQEFPPSYAESSSVKPSDSKIQSTATGDETYDDISQEDKPKYAIMAQLLANGYSLSDKVIQKSIDIDNQKGYTTKFKNFLTSLDEKYIHSHEPESATNKTINQAQGALNELQTSFNKSKYSTKLSHYYEKAANHPYGIKVHDFYKSFAKDVKDVHNEAKRLNALKSEENKGNLDSNVSTANAAAAINTVN